MHKTDASGHASNLFTDGNPSGGVEATVIDDDWLNAVQTEIVNPIETGAGITLVKGTNTQLLSALSLLAGGINPGGRLTLTTAVPVTTDNVTAATTIYYTPYKHALVPLWNGTFWVWREFSELSQTTADNTKSPAAVANNSNYDMFVWNDSGTLRCTRGPAWTSDTGRGTGAGTTELEVLHGRYVNKIAITNGPAAQRGLYVGTVRSDGSAQINDSDLKRHVWNTYHRAPRRLRVVDTTNSWTYSLATYRQANASTANQVDMVCGLSEDSVSVSAHAVAGNSGAGGAIAVAVGLDGTTRHADCVNGLVAMSVASTGYGAHAFLDIVPGLGRHYLTWLEYAIASGTTTWNGDAGNTVEQSGMRGTCWA